MNESVSKLSICTIDPFVYTIIIPWSLTYLCLTKILLPSGGGTPTFCFGYFWSFAFLDFIFYILDSACQFSQKFKFKFCYYFLLKLNFTFILDPPMMHFFKSIFFLSCPHIYSFESYLFLSTVLVSIWGNFPSAIEFTFIFFYFNVNLLISHFSVFACLKWLNFVSFLKIIFIVCILWGWNLISSMKDDIS